MDVVVRSLERLAICLDHRQAGNRHWLAPQGLPAVLDVEGPSWPTRASTGVEENPGSSRRVSSVLGEKRTPRPSVLKAAHFAGQGSLSRFIQIRGFASEGLHAH